MFQKLWRKKLNNSGLFTSSCITPFNTVFFAIGNRDLQIEMADGQLQLHGTAMAIFQEGEAEVQHQVIVVSIHLSQIRRRLIIFHTIQTQVPLICFASTVLFGI